jgi:hypothetical protein
MCVNAGYHRTSQTIINLVDLESIPYVWHATLIKESGFCSALLKGKKYQLITRHPETRSKHNVETPIIFLGKVILSNNISKGEGLSLLEP